MDESYNVLMQIFMPKGTWQYRGKNCVSMRDAHLGKKEREKKKENHSEASGGVACNEST